MKQLLRSFAVYEYWANQRLLSLIMDLSEEQQQREIKSSFPSVYRTALHIWDASQSGGNAFIGLTRSWYPVLVSILP